MCFRIADVKSLLIAALICSLLPAAKAQTNGGGQHILFSAPDGQTSSTGPIPMAQAPEPKEVPNLPDSEVMVHPFSAPPEPPVMFPEAPTVLLPNERRNDSLDPMDIHKQMGALTPQQIMNVPSPEEIFGLAPKAPATQKKPGQTSDANGDTNSLTSDTTALLDEPKWARTWTGDTQASTGSSNTTEKTTGFFSGLLDSSRNAIGFGNKEASDSDTLFGPSQPAAQSGSWDSALSGNDLTPSASASASGFHAFTLPVAAASSSSGFASQAPQSPFATPHVSSMETLPQLPAVPSLPGQNNALSQVPTTPSLAPQPPPWMTRQTPFGTPVQLTQHH